MVDFSVKTHEEFKEAYKLGIVTLNIMPRNWDWLPDYIPSRTLSTLFQSGKKRLLAHMYERKEVFDTIQRKGVDIVFRQ